MRTRRDHRLGGLAALLLTALACDSTPNGPSDDAAADLEPTDTPETGDAPDTTEDDATGPADETGDEASPEVADGDAHDADDADGGACTPVASHREDRPPFIVVWLEGSAYAMGYQHGTLLHDELARGIAESEYVSQILDILPIARWLGLDDYARSQSYPDILEECEGMVDAAGDVGWTMELCLLANFGDVLVEFLAGVLPKPSPTPGCSQLVASGEATADGRVYHGRLLDWGEVDYLLWYPVIFVRQPMDGIPHVYVGFPGNLSPYSGMNAAGLSGASNEADPVDGSEHDLLGHSHVQMLGQILKRAHSLAEAEAIVRGEDHMTVEAFGFADGPNRDGAAFEMTARRLGVRRLSDGVVWLTNHFTAPETVDADADPAGASSLLRYDRLAQLLPRDGSATRFGAFDPPELARVLRDRVDPYTGLEAPVGTFDNDGSLATNGAMYAIVFSPEDLVLWVAAGTLPVPEQPLYGFALAELLDCPALGAAAPVPAVLP
ncbi:MAG: hypothetical protein JXB32_08885 [Deltaproteobacteria bacterium]|nr:hypothetical protein [Deltaproteobacteria bacterium]